MSLYSKHQDILRKKMIRTLTLIAALTLTNAAHASDWFDKCKSFFAGGLEPVAVVIPELKPKALCFSEMAVLYTGTTKTPKFVAEKLNKERLKGALNVERDDEFYEEARLPSRLRAKLEDYRGSGYDRGHLAPHRNFGTEEGAAQSMSLANIAPQNPKMNRTHFNKIEGDVFKYAMRAKGDIYTITGTHYLNKVTIGPGQVWVPNYFYKVVYDEALNRAWGWILPNDDSEPSLKPLSYGEIKDKLGIDFFPIMSKR